MGSRVQILRNQFGLIWSKLIWSKLDPSFHLHSPNQELSFELFFFIASIGQFLVLNPHLKAMGPIIDSQPIGSQVTSMRRKIMKFLWTSLKLQGTVKYPKRIGTLEQLAKIERETNRMDNPKMFQRSNHKFCRVCGKNSPLSLIYSPLTLTH